MSSERAPGPSSFAKVLRIQEPRSGLLIFSKSLCPRPAPLHGPNAQLPKLLFGWPQRSPNGRLDNVRRNLSGAGGPFLRRLLASCQARDGSLAMAAIHVIGGILAAGLLLYLFVALLKPEMFG